MRRSTRIPPRTLSRTRPNARQWARIGGALLLAGIVDVSGVGGQQAADGAGPAEASSSSSSEDASELRVVLITGSTDGLGREVARRVAATGAHVIIHGRNRERGRALVDEINRAGVGSARFYAADFASLDQVRDFAEQVEVDYEQLDVLVNNAGVWLDGPDRRLSQDGYELTFQVNYLSGFLLTRLLLPMLVKSAPSRIINVSSIAQRPIDFDDVMLEHGYSDARAYAQSKLAQVMFTFDLADELKDTGVMVEALHPATMMDTHMVLSRGARAMSSVDEGAKAVLHLVDAPDLETGQYFNGMKPARANEQAYDRGARDKLRRLSAKLTGAPMERIDPWVKR